MIERQGFAKLLPASNSTCSAFTWRSSAQVDVKAMNSSDRTYAEDSQGSSAQLDYPELSTMQ
jgi:hypothetical protein